MASYTTTTPENKNKLAAGHTSKRSSTAATIQAKDNRVEAIAQRKLQEAANNSVAVKQLMVYQTMANSASPVQLVLKDRADPNVEKALINAYHAHEKLGDGFSTGSIRVMDHETAISHYDNAVRERSKANQMHIDPDEGHMGAIKWIEDKISNRRSIIEDLNQAVENRKRQAAALAKRNAGPGVTREPLPRHLASWEPGGKPAWFPERTVAGK